MNKNHKFFCFGFGQVGRYFIKNLIRKKENFELVTTNTTKTEIKEFEGLKYKSYYFSNNEFDNNLLRDLKSSNKILISIPPKNKKDIVIKIFSDCFKKNKFDWIVYLSATSVYGNNDGKWVDESMVPKPTSIKGIARLEAEKSWLNYYKNYNQPVQIFRLSGIYSPESNIIKRLQLGTLKVVKKTNHFFSRIHIEDIAEVLTISLKKNEPGQIFNISDNYPCSNEEVANYASKIMKFDLPKSIEESQINNEMLRGFYKDSKKVDNKKMKVFFNYNLKYPTYKEGLEMIRNHQS